MSLHKEHIIKLSNSDEEYKLIIELKENSDSIQFYLNNVKNKIRENYFLELTQDEFISLNNYFLIFDTINKVANNISNIIKDSTPKLIKENNGMSLFLTIFMPG